MDAAWLKENVGDALTQAMAALATKQPDDPIDFLGRHLVHFVDVQEKLVKDRKAGVQAREREEQEEKEQGDTRAAREAASEAGRAADAAAVSALEQCAEACVVEYDEEKHGRASDVGVADDLAVLEQIKLQQTLEAVQQCTSAHNVYVAKRVGEDRLEFVCSTDPTILGKTLTDVKDDEGNSTVLPFPVFAPVPETEEEEAARDYADAEEGEEKAQQEPKETPLPQFVHVRNMLQDDRVPFFNRVPVLGSFAAVHVPFKRAMHQNAIPEDGGLIVEPAAEEEEAEAEGQDEGKEETANDQEGGEEVTQEGTEEAKEGGEDAEAAEAEKVAEPEKKWRAELEDASYVICFDTMGKETYVAGLPEKELELVRKMSAALGTALSTTEDNRYQAEMKLRDALSALEEESKAIAEAALPELDETVASRLEAFQTKLDEEAEAAAAAASAAETEQAEPEVKLEEATEAAKAKLVLEVVKETLGVADWWKDYLRSYRKLCIEPSETTQRALSVFARVFSDKARAQASPMSWTALKQLDLGAILEAATGFDPELSSEGSCGLDQAAAESFAEELAGIEASEEDPAWIAASCRVAKASIEGLLASAKLSAKLAEIEAERVAAAEEEARLAAEAEAEAEASQEKQQQEQEE